jgi:phosphatidylserine/phosphatidylglycerophosphate/cardiolipin synthase-like enzyme
MGRVGQEDCGVETTFSDWFLSPMERGNPHTAIDRLHGDGAAWTTGNHVEVLLDGAEYFRRLHRALCDVSAGGSVRFTDWEGDADELLDGPGSEVGAVLAGLAARGVAVRGLLWRAHPRQAHFAEQDNVNLAAMVDGAGGEVLLDERVRRGGSHHQKLVIVRDQNDDHAAIAFEGGIDLCHGRHDDAHHLGDPQAVDISERYGPRPPWHDLQLQVHGPAIGALAHTFRERWEDPTPLDHRNPLRRALRMAIKQPRRGSPLPAEPPVGPVPGGTHAVQVLRTYPSKRPRYPFAPDGERSIARAYRKAFGRARSLVYLEDQYFWSLDAARALAEALRRSPALYVVAIVPRYPDRDGRATEAASGIGRERVVDILRRAGGDRVAIYDLENVEGTPIYVHAKVGIVDDVWMAIGSDNLNRRSWTHDSEISCSMIDSERDDRAPVDPAGLGDGARVLARTTRLSLWREHLERDDHDDDLVDPIDGFDALARSAAALDAWHAGGRRGPRPPGHLRVHREQRVGRLTRWWALAMHRALLDPDGRPRSMARAGEF